MFYIYIWSILLDPYDIGDRVDVDSVSYVVKEMHLLYTFVDLFTFF